MTYDTIEVELIFWGLFILSFIAMTSIRLIFQSKVLRDQRKIEVKEDSISLIAGTIAALTKLIFGEEQVLIETFGERYRAYMQRTGRLLPRFKQDRSPLFLIRRHPGRLFWEWQRKTLFKPSLSQPHPFPKQNGE